ncbi:hypothetical protein VP01_343g7 [Puccinia sorghi]|uniref:Uncharacterized protein n=1 Tax=Puccinia sorghi TaxID=27349 RepID=A0A0L6UY70_9BASI|nr:hypothetical protein VP01_343g7 [Puccinia sorghi]
MPAWKAKQAGRSVLTGWECMSAFCSYDGPGKSAYNLQMKTDRAHTHTPDNLAGNTCGALAALASAQSALLLWIECASPGSLTTLPKAPTSPSLPTRVILSLNWKSPPQPSRSQNLLEPVVDTAAAAHPIIQHNSSLEAEVELILYLHGARPGSSPVKAPSVYSQSSSNSVSSSSS